MWVIFDGEQPFIGPSPDKSLECVCYGRAYLEIKYPFLISHKSPTYSDVKLPLLKMINNEQKLNQNHECYTQCQQQMAIAGTENCYFFVYNSHGFYLEEILFDVDYWRYLKSLFIRFYAEIYVPSILQ